MANAYTRPDTLGRTLTPEEREAGNGLKLFFGNAAGFGV